MSGGDGNMATEENFSNALAYPKDDFENELAYNTTMYSNDSVDNDMDIFGGENTIQTCYCYTVKPELTTTCLQRP